MQSLLLKHEIDKSGRYHRPEIDKSGRYHRPEIDKSGRYHRPEISTLQIDLKYRSKGKKTDNMMKKKTDRRQHR